MTRAGVVRAGLRGARPGPDDRREARRGRRSRAASRRVEFDHVDFRYPTADEVSLASLESVAVLDQAPSQQVLHDVVVHRRARAARRAGRPVRARARRRSASSSPRLYDVRSGRGAHQRRRRARRHARVAARHHRRGHPGRAPVPRHHPRQPAVRQARRHRRRDLRRRCAAAQILPLVASLPDGLDTVVGDRGYRFSGGEKQRIAIARLLLKAPDVVVLDEATAHLDSESEAAVQQALETALARAHLDRHRPPALDRARRRPDPGRRRGPHRASGAPTPS